MSLAPVEAWLCHLLLVWGRCCCWWSTSRCSGQAVQSVCCTWHSAITCYQWNTPLFMDHHSTPILKSLLHWLKGNIGHCLCLVIITWYQWCLLIQEERNKLYRRVWKKAANTYFKTLLKNKEAFDHMNTEQGPTSTWSKQPSKVHSSQKIIFPKSVTPYQGNIEFRVQQSPYLSLIHKVFVCNSFLYHLFAQNVQI